MTKTFLLALSIASIAGLPAACSRAAQPLAAPVPQADAAVVRVEPADVPSEFEAGGVLRGRLTALIASRVVSQVGEVLVRPGDRVRSGQPLVTLDGRELRAQAQVASATQTAAQEAVHAAESDQRGADAALTLAQATHGRISDLHARRSATPQELDEAVAALRAAETRAASARAHLGAAAAALTSARAAADAATIVSSYATLIAPFDGLVTERMVDPGGTAMPGAPLLALEDISEFRLDVRLDEARAAGVAVGGPARVHLDGAPGDHWIDGHVAEVSRIDAAAHAFLIRIGVPASATLRPGAFGRARFPGAPRQVLAVPSSAVVRRGQMAFVFAIDGDGLARLRPVTAGPASSDRVELQAGLTAGEQVVVNPSASLVDGTRITAVRGASGGRP